MKIPLFIAALITNVMMIAQVNSTYKISFENAVHHEANITAHFKNIKSDTAIFRMSRSSPGRYAIHEFAKNVYNVEARDKNGNILKLFRTDPYSWKAVNHGGDIKVNYTLFANHADGTYSQVDESHAHLNMPATFMFMEELANNGFEVTFKPREDLNWKIATQLKQKFDNTYSAKNLQYFMDSPTELSNYQMRTFSIEENGRAKDIRFVLHDESASDEDFGSFFENVKKIVLEQQSIYGELPDYDYNEYTFLACYMPQVNGDGMEHRNSTILTSTRSINGEGAARNLGTVAHEFFHCWNVERIRPQSLKPFDFTEANMSGELWFAEGFTSYYDGLTLNRAGITSEDDYLKSIERSFNFVWKAPGRNYFNPIEMSYQAPFVDAARAVDPTNRSNTFISYYSYGDMLGLGLDLALRAMGKNLDDYMKMVWEAFGKTEKGYTINDLQNTLSNYTNEEFAKAYFENFIYGRKMPDFKPLFNNVGVEFVETKKFSLGASLSENVLINDPKSGSSGYKAGLVKGDKIIEINSSPITNMAELTAYLNSDLEHADVKIKVERNGNTFETTMPLIKESSYELQFIPNENLTEEQLTNKRSWLKIK